MVWFGSAGLPIALSSTTTLGQTPSGGTFGTRIVWIDYYCPIDWSADSRYLLAREMPDTVLVELLDQFDKTRYWTLERGGTPRRPFDRRLLQRTVEGYWLAKGRDVSLGGGYFLEAVGWEAPTSNRIVFNALRRVTRLPAAGMPAMDDSPERFLGFWSAETTGLDPRLLAETPDGFVVPRFGRLVSAPSRVP